MEVRGLKNSSNSCYLNVILQSLVPFTSVLFPDITKFKNAKSKLLYHVLYYYQTGNRMNLNRFKDQLQKVVEKSMGDTARASHRDAHECLLSVMDMLPKQTLELYYTGKTTRITQCDGCKNFNRTTEPFEHLLIHVSPTLIGSVNQYFSPSKVELNCDACGKNSTTHTSQFRLKQTPSLLYIIFNRFQPQNNQWIKNKQGIRIPLNVIIDEQHKHELVYAAIHHGNVNSGHYTCYLKHPSGWLKIDDSRVLPISTTDLQSLLPNAYIVLYRQTD